MRSLPEKHQTLLFSATMPVEIEALAKVRFPSLLIENFQRCYFFLYTNSKIMKFGILIWKNA